MADSTAMEDCARARVIAGSPPENGRAIPEPVVAQAISWYVRFASGTITPDDHEQFSRWQAAHTDHARAWERLRGMGGRLQSSSARVAPDVTRATMTRLATLSGRRQALKTLAWMGAGGIGLYLAQDRIPWRGELAASLADIRTPTGGRRDVVLADGTLLRLNTATAIDIRFDTRERRIVLRAGEIMVSTASDPASRPFVVATAEGDLRPVGTRFTVRHGTLPDSAGFTQLAVSAGAVQIHPARSPGASPALVRAGQQVRFTRDRIGPLMPLDDNGQAWLDGMFSAESMRLADFLAELGRYRQGWLRAAPDVADLRITGVWPLDGPDATERILDALERRLPVQVKRYTRYWVTVAAR